MRLGWRDGQKQKVSDLATVRLSIATSNLPYFISANPSDIRHRREVGRVFKHPTARAGISRTLISTILDQHGCNSQRIRSLPAVSGVYFCMALSPHPDVAYEQVFDLSAQGLSRLQRDRCVNEGTLLKRVQPQSGGGPIFRRNAVLPLTQV